MRYSRLAVLPLIGALAMGARPATAQVAVTAQIGQPQYEVRVSPYAANLYGDWRTSYRRWQPVTLYAADGHFYSRTYPGARAVTVYRWQNQYFLPPHDREFFNVDRRYNYDHRPDDRDYRIVEGIASVFGLTPQRSWGNEVFVANYAADLQGDWRRNYRQWQPVTLYYRNGRYFQAAVPGGRAVAVYRWRGQYFLPPTDEQWRNADRRYNYSRAPTQDDYNNPQRDPARYGQQDQAPVAPAPSTGYGNDVNVRMYTPREYGVWQTTYRQWQPVTLYHLNGRYFPNQVPGSRPVMVYQYQGQYFLPPRDLQWENFDRRYDYKLRPIDQDYSNMRRSPTQ